MFVADKCIICSGGVIRWPGEIAPFIVNYVFDGRAKKYNLCYCPSCQMIFSDTRFDEAEVKRLYTNYRGEEYCRIRETYEPDYRKINDKIGTDVHGSAIRKHFIEFLLSKENVSGVRSVLDYRGDRGQFIPDVLSNTKRFVYDVSGVQPIDDVRTVAKADEAAPYDLVMCCQVLEHVSFPNSFLDELRGLLVEGGLLYIEVPAGIPTRRYFDVTVGRHRIDRVWRPRMHEHINYFTKASLRNALLLSGFSPLHTEIRILDVGWSLSPTIGSVAVASSKASRPKYGGLDMFMEGFEYGIRRNVLPFFKN